MRTFTRPGFSTVTIEDAAIEAVLANPPADCPYKPAQLNELSAAHYLASRIWKEEAEQIAAALEMTAAEYTWQARAGLVAKHIEANGRAYDVRWDTQGTAGRACAASLYRQAARAYKVL